MGSTCTDVYSDLSTCPAAIGAHKERHAASTIQLCTPHHAKDTLHPGSPTLLRVDKRVDVDGTCARPLRHRHQRHLLQPRVEAAAGVIG